jgi:hypothetical protein
MFNHTVTEARRLGMNIDLTPSGGWRLGGPHVTKEHSERTFAVKDGKIEARWIRNVRQTHRSRRRGPVHQPVFAGRGEIPFRLAGRSFPRGQGDCTARLLLRLLRKQGNWAPELPGRFQQWRGYDIHDARRRPGRNRRSRRGPARP